MKRLVVMMLMAGAALFAYSEYRMSRPAAVPDFASWLGHGTGSTGAGDTSATNRAAVRYECRGRRHCSQMTSCDEATWVLRHCPDTRMDGDGDGVPCEDQWCDH